ncbi:hypothetical protein [Halotia branconii]|uniref:Uncharacterized protein n=1 Tax=Halotia branconii CENA392 TaxID=1539056 RepID=A0AAJ6NX42_9CYAN|nr:hypothetical protein [Halotia branconii]WGV28088.1 hypothetical protein QI031_11660 [Halotia branconii CENA392]
MDAFAPIPPKWTDEAIHADGFYCPKCHSSSLAALKVWINRRSPVMTEDHRRKWQEFYKCNCGFVWWAWSSDRPPIDISNQQDYNPL